MHPGVPKRVYSRQHQADAGSPELRSTQERQREGGHRQNQTAQREGEGGIGTQTDPSGQQGVTAAAKRLLPGLQGNRMVLLPAQAASEGEIRGRPGLRRNNID